MDQTQVGSNIRNGRTSCEILRTTGFEQRIRKACLSEDSYVVLLV